MIEQLRRLLGSDPRLRGQRVRVVSRSTFGQDACFFRSGLGDLGSHYPRERPYERVFRTIEAVLADSIVEGCVSGYLYQMPYEVLVQPPQTAEPNTNVFWSMYLTELQPQPVRKLARFWRADKIPALPSGHRPVTFNIEVVEPCQLEPGLWEAILEPTDLTNIRGYRLVSLQRIEWTPMVRAEYNLSRMTPSQECLLPSMCWT